MVSIFPAFAVFLMSFHFVELVQSKAIEYCIIGCGPAGLQMAHHLQQSGRSYMVYERNNVCGSFFKTHPRHRKLISINKRHTGRRNVDFNLRHDWNSILSNDTSLRFGKYSKDYFPHADLMVPYFEEYRKSLNLSVQFNTTVSEIRNVTLGGDSTWTFNDQNKNRYHCKVLLLATGIWKSVYLPSLEGNELTENYENFSTNPDDYEGKQVLIIGTGNSGFETALSVYGAAAFVHMVGRKRVRMSWDTHYVGDVRGVNNEILDADQLKSLDGVIFYGEIDKFKLVRGSDGRIHLKKKNGAREIRVLQNEDESESVHYDHFPLRMGYDKVLVCTGFKWDPSIFHKSVIIKNHVCKHGKAPKAKYPEVQLDLRSSHYENLYFIGGLSHSLDFRKSSGGFIHGFRYTVRMLHKILQFQRHQQYWPSTSGEAFELATKILLRVNTASGLYQMFSFLGDVVIINKETGSFKYLNEFPVRLLPKLEQYSGHRIDPSKELVLVITFQLGTNFSIPGADHFQIIATADLENAHKSDYLHPVLYVYDVLPTEQSFDMKPDHDALPKPVLKHHVIEDFTTQFNGPSVHVRPLRKFLEVALHLDLKSYAPERCLEFALTRRPSEVPPSCRRYKTMMGSEALVDGIPGEEEWTPITEASADSHIYPAEDSRSQDDEVELYLQSIRNSQECYFCSEASKYVKLMNSTELKNATKNEDKVIALFHVNVDSISRLALHNFHVAAQRIFAVEDKEPKGVFALIECHEDDCERDFTIMNYLPQIWVFNRYGVDIMYTGPFEVPSIINLYNNLVSEVLPIKRLQSTDQFYVVDINPATFPLIYQIQSQKPLVLKVGGSLKIPKLESDLLTAVTIGTLSLKRYPVVVENILQMYGFSSKDCPLYLYIDYKSHKVYALKKSDVKNPSDIISWMRKIATSDDDSAIVASLAGTLKRSSYSPSLLFDYSDDSALEKSRDDETHSIGSKVGTTSASEEFCIANDSKSTCSMKKK